MRFTPATQLRSSEQGRFAIQAPLLRQVPIADRKSIFYSESRFGGFTDLDGTALYLRVNALAASKDVVLELCLYT